MIAKTIGSLDRISENALLGVNLFLAAFVLLAHGGYTALTLSEGGKIPFMIMISVPLSILFILTCIAGFILSKYRLKVLSVQALILFIGSLFTIYYGLSILVRGLPEGNFSWGLGLFTFFCVYPVYLIRRTIFKGLISRSNVIKYAHVFVLIIALSIDIAVFTKAAAHFENYQRELFEKHRVK
jgi:hypothetical protein